MGEEQLPEEVQDLRSGILSEPLLWGAISTVPYFGGTFATFFSAKQFETFRARTVKLLSNSKNWSGRLRRAN